MIGIFLAIYVLPQSRTLSGSGTGQTLLSRSETGCPILEPAAPFENWTRTLVFRVRV